jgi:hypothetical protein
MSFLLIPFAFGQDVPVPNPVEDLGGFFETLYAKLQSSEWLVAFGIGLIGLVEVVKRGLPWIAGMLSWDRVKTWMQTRLGKTIIAVGTATLLTMGTTLAAGEGFSWQMVTTALAAAWVASGGWQVLKDLFEKEDA